MCVHVCVRACSEKDCEVETCYTSFYMFLCQIEQVLQCVCYSLSCTCRVLAAHHDTDWDDLRCRAITTAPTAECPICISPILPTSNSSHTPSRPISLLFCGHLLHETCVISLEQYCTISDLPQCPLYRAAYQRQPLYH